MLCVSGDVLRPPVEIEAKSGHLIGWNCESANATSFLFEPVVENIGAYTQNDQSSKQHPECLVDYK